MADGPPAGGDGPDDSQRLSVDDIRYLRRLGDALSAAPNAGEQAEITALLLRVARRHRADDIGWDQLALAIGVAEDELRGWQRAETDPETDVDAPHLTTLGPGHRRARGCPTGAYDPDRHRPAHRRHDER